jgi:hypothetical protein
MDALWLATGMLSISLLLFVCTVLVVIYSKWNPGAGALGVVFLILGLVLMVLSVIAECYEIALGRKSMTLELLDLSAKNISQINSKED